MIGIDKNIIPDDWSVKILGEIANVSSGGSAPQGERYFNGANPFVRVQHIDRHFDSINNYDLITDEAIKKYKLKKYKSGTIVFPKSGASIYLEKRAMLPVDAYIVSHLCAVNVGSQKMNQEFLFYELKNIKLAENKADGYPTLNLSEVKNVKVLLPPLPEQQKIAYVLSKIQQAIEQQGKIIQTTKELKKSLMNKLFTEGLHREEQKEIEIGLIPKSWEVISIGELLDKNILIIQNGFPCGNWNDKGKGVPQLRPFNITEEGYIDMSNLKYIKTDRYIDEYILKKGDVIFNNTNSEKLVGKTALWHEKGTCVLSNHMTIIRVLDKDYIIPLYLARLLHKKWFDGFYLGLCRRHVNQASVGIERIKGIRIGLPNLEDQKEIANILSNVDKKIQQVESRKQTLQSLFKTMLNQLMTGRIRIKDVDFGKIPKTE